MSGVGGGDARIVPAGDLAEKNVGIDVARQLQILRLAGKVVSEDDFAGGHRQQNDAVRYLGDFLRGHGGVARGEIDRLVDQILNARAGTFGLVIDRGSGGLLAEVLEPG